MNRILRLDVLAHRPILDKCRDLGLTDPNKYSEPNLFDIIKHYYTSHDVAPDQAEAWAREYVEKWVQMVNDA